MISSVKAGIAYFAIIFAAGFMLGTIRVLLLIPRIGETWAVLAELPVMMMLSWFVCGWLLRRFGVPRDWGNRLRMGGVAFVFE